MNTLFQCSQNTAKLLQTTVCFTNLLYSGRFLAFSFLVIQPLSASAIACERIEVDSMSLGSSSPFLYLKHLRRAILNSGSVSDCTA